MVCKRSILRIQPTPLGNKGPTSYSGQFKGCGYRKRSQDVQSLQHATVPSQGWHALVLHYEGVEVKATGAPMVLVADSA